MQFESMPSLFEAPRQVKPPRNTRITVSLKPIVKSNLLTDQALRDQHNMINQNPNYFQNPTDIPPLYLNNSGVTRSPSPFLEPGWKKHRIDKNESIKNLVYNQKLDRNTSFNPKASMFEYNNAVEPRVFQPLSFVPSQQRSVSVDPLLKKLELKKRAEFRGVSSLLDVKVNNKDFNSNNNNLPTLSNIPEASVFPPIASFGVRERSNSDLNQFELHNFQGQGPVTRQRSPSVETSLKKVYAQKNDSARATEPYERNPIIKLKNHLESTEVFPSLPQQGHARGSSQIVFSQPDQAPKSSEENPADSKLRTEFYKGHYRHLSLPDTSASKRELESTESDSLDNNDPQKNVFLPKLPMNIRDFAFAPNVKEDVLKKHIFNIIQGCRYAVRQVKAPPISQLKPKQIQLRKMDSTSFKKTLVLDLDETLITTRSNKNLKDSVKEITPPRIKDDQPEDLKIKVRPFAEQFLKAMSKEFEIVIFTAADRKYAEICLSVIDPNQEYVTLLIHRDYCLRTKKGLFIKDLRIFKNRDLKDMVIVDNFTPSFSFQIDNGIPIITWDGEAKDQELKYLMKYLLEAKEYDDMRVYNREKLKLETLAELPIQRTNPN